MHTLIYQLPATRKFWVGPPFPVITNPAPLPVTRADEHERTKGAGLEDFSRLEKGWMVTVIVADPHAHVMLFGEGFKLLQFLDADCAGLFDEHVLTGLHRLARERGK